MEEDAHLIEAALARADGSTIHRVRALVALYRDCAGKRPEICKLYEQALRAFVATGQLDFKHRP